MWFFFHTYVIVKYCKDKISISHLFSVHVHKYHTNLGKHGSLGGNGRGKVNRSRPIYYDIDMDLHYIWGLYRPTPMAIIQYLDRER